MTIYGLHLAFRDAVDKLNSSAVPMFGPEQVDRYLNIGAEKLVKNRYNGNSYKGSKFEEEQQNVDEINFLVTYLDIDPLSEGYYNQDTTKTMYFNIPSNYWFAIAERCEVSKEPCPKILRKFNCSTKEFEDIVRDNETLTFGVYARRHNEINSLLDDPYNKPYRDYMWRVISDGKIQLFYDYTYLTPTKYKLAYIRQFDRIEEGKTYNLVDEDDGDSENWFNKEFWFPSSTHQLIVDYAAKAVLESIEQTTRTQSFPKEVTEKE